MYYFVLGSLRLYQHFESFRVLVCGGDGSIGWVLNAIDQLGLHKQVGLWYEVLNEYVLCGCASLVTKKDVKLTIVSKNGRRAHSAF
jgi:hypothetical protein